MKAAGILGALLLAAALVPAATGSFHEQLAVVPERAFALAMTGTTFNGLHGDEHPVLEAFVGERVTFHVLATEAHTFHLHGHPWLLDDGRLVDTFLVDADTPHSFVVRAGGIDGNAGDWLFHCHIQEHHEAGMWGILRVHPAGASGPLGPTTLRHEGHP